MPPCEIVEIENAIAGRHRNAIATGDSPRRKAVANRRFRAKLPGFKREAPLSEVEDWSLEGRRNVAPVRPHARPVAFDRRELNAILQVYGRKVAEGEWRDYAIDHLPDRAVFSILRRSNETPMFRVEKTPALARKQGAYRVVASGGLILKRGHDLAAVLKVLEKPKLLLVM